MMQYAVYAEGGVSCTLCMLYSVYAVLSICCTLCEFLMMIWGEREG